MGLFNIFKKKEKKVTTTEFSSHVVKTDNISKELNNISKKYNIASSNLDFDILQVDTFVKLSADGTFVAMDIDTAELITEKDLLLDDNVEIRQSYDIKVKKFSFDDDFELRGTVRSDKYLTHATYYVSPSSILKYSDKLELKIKEELNKKKIKAGMLIDVDFFDSTYQSDIGQLVAKLRVLGGIEGDYGIELCKAIPPVKSIKIGIIEHYKKHETTDERVNDLIYPIKQGQIVVEVTKPKIGRNGRSCNGKSLKVAEINIEDIPEFKIDDDVRREEDGNAIRYMSTKNGYVYIKDNEIVIKDELEVNQISLKTGNIIGAEDSDVRLEVKESGALQEAIRDGMVVETTELIVKGNVGNGAKIKAKILKIDGQTHKGSKIIAQNAEINVQKGYLKANTVLVNRLEGGIIEANSVHIKQAISGKITAKEIKIDLLGSHITLIASELIEIEGIRGSENKFIIDNSSVSNKTGYVDKLEENYDELRMKINSYKDKLFQNKNIILRNRRSVGEIKKKIKDNRANKIATNPTFIKKVKKFNDFVRKTKAIEEEIESMRNKQDSIKEELNQAQDGVFLAKIICHSGFTEFNRMEFRLVEPPITITYDTKDIDASRNIFILKDYGEMEYKIIGEKE